MNSQNGGISVGGFIYRLVSIAVLVFLLMKSQAALTKAKEGLAVVEPVWKTGEATSGVATADGPVTKTRIFFKAQEVTLEYNVNGVPYTCRTRMLKKDFDKLDGEKKEERDGKADVLLRYDPANPSVAVTEQSYTVLKKEKDSYTAVKWLSIIYLVIDVLGFLLATISAIGQAGERRKAEALIRRRMEDAQRAAEERARQAAAREAMERARQEAKEREQREAAERARREAAKAAVDAVLKEEEENKRREAAERARKEAERAAIFAQHEAEEKARQEAEEKERREANEKLRRILAERARKEAEEKARQKEEWDKVLDDALREAQDQNKADSGKGGSGLSEDWKKVLDETAAEAERRQSGTAYDGTVYDGTVFDGTIFDAEPASSGDDGTVYDGTVFDGTVFDGTVFDGDSGSRDDGGTVYDGTVFDGDYDSHDDNGTVYDGSLGDGGTVYDGTLADDGTVYDGPKFGAGSDDYPKGYELGSTYVIDSKPIVGGMGKIWKVHHKDWDVDLAMKRPRAEYFKSDKQKEDFIEECEAWINLGIHPNIVACYYVRELDGVPTIFSEWMENGSLAERISDKTLYGGSQEDVSERLLDIAIQFAEGLHCAHRTLLIHRDVKPANVLLTNEWDARVGDFGIAQLGKKKTKEGSMTPAYCSPEQAAGKKLTRKTDIYSWAVSILEMYLGYRPWQHGTLVGVACQQYFDMAKIPMPNRLRDLLVKCLENEAKNRPRDFASVIKELKAIYKEVTGKAYPRPAAKVSVESADKLNNRALSYLDLNREAETEDLWTRAAFLEPANVPALFNRCLYGYRSGGMTLYEAQCFLSANWENHFNKAEPGLLLAELSLEGGDYVNAKDVLSYVRNYSSQQEEFSDQTEERLSQLEKIASTEGKWRCAYQLSRVKNYKEEEKLQKERDKQLRELKNLAKKGKWDAAGKVLMISHLTQQLGEVLYQEDWMAFYEELSRKCTPTVVLGQWPLKTISGMHRHDRVSFSDDSKYLLCGQKLFELETGKLIRDNGLGLDLISRTRASAISPDGTFYLSATEGGTRFAKIDVLTGETLVVCSGHEKSITALAISRDGQCFASGDEGGTLKLWDCNGNLIRSSKIALHGDEALEDIQFGYDYRKMVLRYEDYVLLSDQVEGSMDTISYDNYLEVAVNLGYTEMGMAAGRKGLRYLDLETNEERVLNDEDAIRRRGQGISTASQVCFMHNQRYLLASDSSILYFFDPINNKILSSIHMGGNFESIAVSRNGKYIAAISGGKAQVWRCIYGLRYFEELSDDEIVEQCAHVQCSAHPDQSAEQLLAPLMEELADRGYGAVDSETALEALQEAHG